MVKSGSASIVDHFVELEDPRMGRNRRHKLVDIVVLTVCAVISGDEASNKLPIHMVSAWAAANGMVLG